MERRGRRWTDWAVACAVLVFAGWAFLAGRTDTFDLSSKDERAELVLWAWERPEDLRFLATVSEELDLSVGVAPLVGTVRLSSQGLQSLGRRQPLAVPRGIETTAVVRVEILADDPPELAAERGEALADSVIERIVAWTPDPPPRAVQIDFDARLSERDFYRRLLHRLAAVLPAGVALEITALASWCMGDPWIDGLPVDDAVPMFFRMGHEHAAVRKRLASGRDLTLPLCRQSVGVSTDEAWPHEILGQSPTGLRRRVFLFHPRPWDASAFDLAAGRLPGRTGTI